MIAGLAASAGAEAAAGIADSLEEVKVDVRLKKFADAAQRLRRLADAGDAQAQYLLASFYLNGLSGPPDPLLAREWFERAASQGHARAAFSLANLLSNAAPPDPQGASHWLTRARELGFNPAAGDQDSRSAPGSLLVAAQLTDSGARREALWLAAGSGDLESARALSEPTLIGARDEFGRGALARAAQAGSAPVTELLLRRGAAADEPDHYGITPLMLAARRGDPMTVEVLLKAHADVNSADSSGNTVLMHAAAGGHLAAVEQLLAAHAATAARNSQDWSALDFAEVAGAADVAARLRQGGASALHRAAIGIVSAPSTVQRPAQGQRDLYAGWPDITVAATRRSTGLLQSVLARGADANAVTPDGRSALAIAAVMGSAPAIETLLGAGAKSARGDARCSPLLTAVRAGRGDSVAALLAGGAPADGGLKDAEPPLIAAAKSGNTAIMRALLSAGARPDARDAAGASALILVAQAGDAESVRRLLDAGAPPDGADLSGRTALWRGAQARRLEAVQVLIQRGAAIDLGDAAGLTPLAAAAGAGATGIVEALVTKGARVDARTRGGDTALLLAANLGALDTLDRLLVHGADKDAQNRFGDTALIVASRNGNTAVVRRLLSAGASTRLRNKDRLTAADVAAARSFASLAELLKGA